jgi:hypothetical protein
VLRYGLGHQPDHSVVMTFERRIGASTDAVWAVISDRIGPTTGTSLAPFTESLDLMDDGSLVLLSTPGHVDHA